MNPSTVENAWVVLPRAEQAARVKRVVREHFGLSPAELQKRIRPQEIVWPRQIAFYLCRELIHGSSLNEIAKWFGEPPFDHGTILHGCNKVEDRMTTETAVALLVEELSQRVNRLFPSDG